MVAWRKFLRDQLVNFSPLTDVVPVTNIHGGGSVRNRPHPPAVIIHIDAVNPAGRSLPVHAMRAAFWIYDNPGSYVRIDDALSSIKEAMEELPTTTGLFKEARWEGDSQDLADDEWDMITRNTRYLLHERR